MTTQRDIEELLESYSSSPIFRELLRFFRQHPSQEEELAHVAKHLLKDRLEVKFYLDELVKRGILTKREGAGGLFYKFSASSEAKVWIDRFLKTEERKREKLQLSCQRFRERTKWQR